jgi:hypothetical protein
MQLPKGYRKLLPHESLKQGDKHWSQSTQQWLAMPYLARVGSSHKPLTDGIYVRPVSDDEERYYGYFNHFLENDELWGRGFTKEKIISVLPDVVEEVGIFIQSNDQGLMVEELKEKLPETYDLCMGYMVGAIAQQITVKGNKC